MTKTDGIMIKVMLIVVLCVGIAGLGRIGYIAISHRQKMIDRYVKEVSRLEYEMEFLKSPEGRRDQEFKEFLIWCDLELFDHPKEYFGVDRERGRAWTRKGTALWQSRYQREEISWVAAWYSNENIPVIFTSMALPAFKFQKEFSGNDNWQFHNEVVPTGRYSVIYCRSVNKVRTVLTYTQMLQAMREQGVFDEILSPTSPDFDYWQVNGLKNPEVRTVKKSN